MLHIKYYKFATFDCSSIGNFKDEYYDHKGRDTDKKYRDKIENFEIFKLQFELESFHQLKKFEKLYEKSII